MGNCAGQQKLSKADLEFLKANTNYEEEVIQEWFKGFIVDCPDGKLSPAAFMNIYSKCFLNVNSQELCEHVFRTFDSDKNGYIDFKEFLLAIDVTSSGSAEEKLSWAFRMYDVDGNGWIDLNEMTKIVKNMVKMQSSIKVESSEQLAKDVFSKIDVNSDGKITQQEFVQACLKDQKLKELLSLGVRNHNLDNHLVEERYVQQRDCPECMLVEVGEMANYDGLPCSTCGYYSNVPYSDYY